MTEPIVSTIDDTGYLRICIDSLCTTCSSSHLVPDKIAQLQRAMSKLTPEEQVRLLRTQTLAYGANDIIAMSNRQAALDALYHLDGRHLDGHPFKSTYTGLWSSLNENR